MSAEPASVTRFPKLRYFLGLVAVLCPLLTCAALALVGAGRWGLAAAAAGVASVLMLSGMGFTGSASAAPTGVSEAQGSWIVGRLAGYLLIFWGFTLPELDTLVHRLLHEGGLWDWRLLGAACLMAWDSILSGLRRLSAITDQELYSTISGIHSHEAIR